jgi:hypothetical protein
VASRSKFPQRLAELQHDDIAVRRRAARKLGDYGNPAALPELCAALRDPSWKVQRNAAVALGKLGDPAAIEALASVFIASIGRKRYLSVCKETLRALGRIGTEAAAETIATVWLGEQDDVRETAQVALLDCALTAVPVVCQKLIGIYSRSKPAFQPLTTRTSTFWITTEIALHLLPGRQAQIHHSALFILQTLIDKHGSLVFERILATPKLPPQAKFGCLEILRRRRKWLTMIFYFRDARSFCEHSAATSDDPAVRIGAREVLDYCSLARGSMQPLTAASDQLLRAAETDSIETPENELLRGSDSESPTMIEGQEPVGLVAKALRLFRPR